MYKIKIISSSIRPGRKGPFVAKWIADLASAHGSFEVELFDLGEVNLPLMNEPVQPAKRQYQHEHTKQWSAKIDEADAFIFVTAEYDYAYPAPLRNAIEYLVHEWGYKPSGIVSYSAGSFAGVRAAKELRGDLIAFKNVALAEGVSIPSVQQFINEDGKFVPNEQILASANTMLHQLVRWTKGMKAIKEDV